VFIKRSINKRLIFLISCLLVIALGVAILSSCVASAVTASEVEGGIYTQVNKLRQDNGLNILTRDPSLDALARQFAASQLSQDLENSTELHYLLHNSWWVSYSGGSPRLVQGTAQDQVEYCFKNSDLRDAMLRSEARATGVGVAIVGNKVYYTQVFDVLNAVGGNGSPIRLQENPQAVDVTWEQVKQFVMNDDTNSHIYITGSFVCADFAAMLYNRAEAAGIKTAYVSVDFTEGPGHALDVFNTTDRGLVYIDCTGPGFQAPTFGQSLDGQNLYAEYDKVAYIEVGQPYGLISLDKATSFDYAFYEQWTQQWADYEAKVNLYNTGTLSFKERQVLRSQIEALQAILGSYRWEPLGIVARVDVHW
jgi:hypothetical protein